MEDLNSQVVRAFGRKLRNYSKIKGSYLCVTDKGPKVIKKVDNTKENLMFQHMLKEHLYDKNFPNIDRFCISLDGLPYYTFNNTTYIMLNHIDGVECDLIKNSEIAVKQLAIMHNLLYGLDNTINSVPCELVSFYKKRTSEMARLKKRISDVSNLTELDINILKNYDEYYNLCEKSIHILENSNYQQLINRAITNSIFCHNNYREENIIINVNNIYITNFENACCDIHMIDLANIIRRYMKNLECSELQAFKLLEIYNNIKPITKEELKVLLAILIFPYKFLKICNKYYNRRRSWVQNGMVYNLKLYLNNKEKNNNLLSLIEKVC